LHFVHAGSHVLEVVALHHHGNAAGDFDIFDGAPKFGAGFRESLAIFDSDDSGEFVEIFFEEIPEREQVSNALAGRRAAPSREGIGGSLNGRVDVCRSRRCGSSCRRCLPGLAPHSCRGARSTPFQAEESPRRKS